MGNKLKVAILGLGPTGSFAARAAYDMGCDVKIYVHGTIHSTPPGAFWLHWIPDSIDTLAPAETIHIMGVGKAEDYIKLQWGDHSKGVTSSFPTQPVKEQGYDPAEVLPDLVPDECELIPVAYKLSDKDAQAIARGFDVVFQTFPKAMEHPPALLPYVAAARFGYVPNDSADNLVVYNGTGVGIVVREAQLFGNHYLEFPKGLSLDAVKRQHDLTGYQVITLRDIDPATKPIKQDPANKIQYVGRFATWNRHELSHHAYHLVRQRLAMEMF